MQRFDDGEVAIAAWGALERWSLDFLVRVPNRVLLSSHTYFTFNVLFTMSSKSRQ
jgi:hypothetical protein